MKNFYSRILVIVLISFLFGHTSWGQSYSRISTDDAFNTIRDLLKSNHALVNGVFFVDKHRNDIGHPFLNSPYFSEGTFNFNNIDYSDCKLGYNLVEQEIVIVEKGDIKIERPFIPPVEFITRFRIGNKDFIRDNAENRFYQQVFESEHFIVLAFLYKKAVKSYHKKNILAYKYSNIMADIFIVIDNKKLKITTKRTYLSLFPEETTQALSAYIKKNKISFKKSEVSELNNLFYYTQELIEGNEINL